MNTKSKIVILLTGTVNPQNKHFTALTDADRRRNDYIETIRHYMHAYPYPVVFSENSGEDLSGYFENEIKSQRLEVLCFSGNDYDPSIGKGLGEMNCIRHAIEHSRILKDDVFVFKITGRYTIANFNRFVSVYEKNPALDLIADLTNNFRFSSAAIFGFRPFFIAKYLLKNDYLINDTSGYYFEHALAKAVLEAVGDHVNFHLFKYYPRIVAVSGTTGKAYKKSFFYMLPRQLKYFIRHLIVIR